MCPCLTTLQDNLHFNLRPDNDTMQRLPAIHLPAATFATLNGRNTFFIFGGRYNTDKISSDLIAIDVDDLEWRIVHVDGGPVTPRRAAEMTVIGNKLYIFGGDKGFSCNDNDVLNSFSLAEYCCDTDRWTWVVRDEPYPDHVPFLGYQALIAPVYGGKKILLMPGRERIKEASFLTYDMS
jgi:hypothetical protein